jgi:hypothetical protein
VILGSLVPTLLVEVVGLPLVVLCSALLLVLLGGLGLFPIERLASAGRTMGRVEAAA